MNLSKLTEKELIDGVFSNNIAILSRVITLIESTNLTHRKLANTIIDKCLKANTKTIRIGITGVPGAGKSTFIEQFGKLLIQKGKKVAVLTIDPSSSKTLGSILGDKTRMEELVKEPNAFIRPSPSGNSLGGVTRTTRESIIPLEAAGYDIIIIETMGVGQSEIAVQSMVDFFLVLKLAGAGDELQGIKRGILEMADAIAINKADGDNVKRAELAQTEFQNALHMFPPKENGWIPRVLTCSAIENTGLIAVWNLIEEYCAKMNQTGSFDKNRQEQNKSWLINYLEQQVLLNFYKNPETKKYLPKITEAVLKENIAPFTAAEQLLNATKKRNS